MKNIRNLILGTCVLVLIGAATPAFAQGRIATVDLNRLFDRYWKTIEAKASFEDVKNTKQQEGRAMVEEYNKAEEDYKALLASSSDPAISESERDKKKKDAEDKLRYLRDQKEVIMKFQNAAAADLDARRQRMRDNILGELRKAVDSKAKEKGYSMVIDVAAESVNRTPVILFNNGENDITDALVELVNASAPPESIQGSAPDKTAPKK